MNTNKKHIAKNTFFLYIRMFITMFLALYISRLILKYLGAEDYGIYGVVGSVVTLFSFFNLAMSIAGQRCLSVNLANDRRNYSKTYGAILVISASLALVVIIILQIFGPNFIQSTLNIPPDRLEVAILVFHASCIVFFLNTIRIPFISSLIAKEKMNVYSLLSVLDTLLLFFIALSLKFISIDKLLFYSYGIVISNLIVLVLFSLLGLKDERLSFKFSKVDVFEISRFFGWNILGGLASVGLYQGIQILLNLFFNPLVNTAQTLTLQVKSAIESFASNIRVASNPQIIKNSSEGNLVEAEEIVFMSMKFSAIVILMVSIPLFIKIDYILFLWLDNPPIYTNMFIQLYIINAIIDVISSPIVTVIQSIGNLKRYQILSSITLLLVLPITYILFILEFPPYYYGFVIIGSTVLMLVIRIVFLLKLLNISRKKVISEIFKLSFVIPVSVFIISYLFSLLVKSNLYSTLLVIFISTLSISILSWILLLKDSEKEMVKRYLALKLSRLN